MGLRKALTAKHFITVFKTLNIKIKFKIFFTAVQKF